MDSFPAVKERLTDARVLWTHGRKEGALIHVLIAAIVTSRRRYPKSAKNPNTGKAYGRDDREAFLRFVLDEMEMITGGPRYGVAFPFNGAPSVPLAMILWKHCRNKLFHEGCFPGAELIRSEVHEGQRYSVLKLTDPLGFPEGWIINLAAAVTLAPENDEEFADDPERPTAVAEAMAKRVKDDPSSFYFEAA